MIGTNVRCISVDRLSIKGSEPAALFRPRAVELRCGTWDSGSPQMPKCLGNVAVGPWMTLYSQSLTKRFRVWRDARGPFMLVGLLPVPRRCVPELYDGTMIGTARVGRRRSEQFHRHDVDKCVPRTRPLLRRQVGVLHCRAEQARCVEGPRRKEAKLPPELQVPADRISQAVAPRRVPTVAKRKQLISRQALNPLKDQSEIPAVVGPLHGAFRPTDRSRAQPRIHVRFECQAAGGDPGWSCELGFDATAATAC